MGIIRANRAAPQQVPGNQAQQQQQRVRAREATYYQRQYYETEQARETAYVGGQQGYAAHQAQQAYDDQQGYEPHYETQKSHGRAQQAEPQAAPYAQQAWDEAPNETLDLALHLASHDTRLGRLEQAVGHLNQNLVALHKELATERDTQKKRLIIMGCAFAVALGVVAFVPRQFSEQMVNAKVQQAMQVIAANMAASVPSSMPAAPVTAARPAYVQQPVMQPPAMQQVPQQQYQQRPAIRMMPSSNAAPVPGYLPNTPSALGAQVDAASARASAGIPTPPAPPIRVSQVFTPFQNKVRAKMAKGGEIIPASWQAMFDREAKGDLKGKLQVAAKFLKGEDVTRDQAFAVQLIREAAEAGEKEAIMWLAYANQAGNLGRVDLTQAVHWFEVAGKAGVTKAFTELGRIYEAGIDGAPDTDTALAWYQRAAGAGDAQASEAVTRLTQAQQKASTTQLLAQAATPIAAAPVASAVQIASATPQAADILYGNAPRPAPASVAMMQPASAAPIADVANPPDTPVPAAANMPIAPTVEEGSAMNVAMDNAGDVRAVQRMLKALGYKIERVDGQMGPQTTKAIRTYQRSKMLYPDGEPGPQLMESLMNDMRWGNQ